jgi:hypothetical protein
MTRVPTPVIIESPYAGDVPLHLRYVRACLRDSLLRGEAPLASHHLFTAPGVLVDAIPEERAQGINAGFAWRALARYSVFYTDLGWSGGMTHARAEALRTGHLCEVRELGFGWLVAQLRRELEGHARKHWRESVGEP